MNDIAETLRSVTEHELLEREEASANNSNDSKGRFTPKQGAHVLSRERLSLDTGRGCREYW